MAFCSKIRFKWITDKDTKETKYQDLSGPDKVRLFTHIDIPPCSLLCQIKRKLDCCGRVFSLIKTINAEEIDNTARVHSEIKK